MIDSRAQSSSARRPTHRGGILNFRLSAATPAIRVTERKRVVSAAKEPPRGVCLIQCSVRVEVNLFREKSYLEERWIQVRPISKTDSRRVFRLAEESNQCLRQSSSISANYWQMQRFKLTIQAIYICTRSERGVLLACIEYLAICTKHGQGIKGVRPHDAEGILLGCWANRGEFRRVGSSYGNDELGFVERVPHWNLCIIDVGCT